MEEGVSNKKNYKSENNADRKEAGCLDDINNNKNEKYDAGRNEDKTTDAESTTLD